MRGHRDWDATFIPGTSVLANKVGITDADELRFFEYNLSAFRQTEIETGRFSIEHTFDAEHLLAIHRHLFSDLYAWAGVIRTYPLWKNPAVPFAEPDQIHAYLDCAQILIADTDWDALDHDEFAARLATVFAYVNHAHPTREGNGRASKIFMTQLAVDHGRDLDFGRVTRKQWNDASALSPPDRGAFHPVPDFLVPVFARLLV